MGTESIASPRRDPKDVRQKIQNYLAYFRSEGYKRYERVWGCTLRGFRLLFLANSHARCLTLCRLVEEMPPSNFVWATDQEKMFEHGLADAIWARGGHAQKPLESILNHKLCHPSPVLPVHP